MLISDGVKGQPISILIVSGKGEAIRDSRPDLCGPDACGRMVVIQKSRICSRRTEVRLRNSMDVPGFMTGVIVFAEFIDRKPHLDEIIAPYG
jgi:hypothetical protein